AGAAALALWLTRRGTVPRQRWLMQLAVASILASFAANSAGWIFTEMGRQPFVVAPNPDGVDGVFMFTAAAVSPGVSFGEILFSLSAFTLVYAVLMVFEIRLLVRYVRGGIASAVPELAHPPQSPSDKDDDDSTSGDVLAFAY
ncbi:MAG: cytochrome ubiquinol oxidase subunit I, partial [Lacisediminihabitans sp.]